MERLFQALSYLHEKHICHRDITSYNIIYDNKEKKLKLIDFSVAKKLTYDKLWTKTGNMNFMAPEVLSDNECGYTQ